MTQPDDLRSISQSALDGFAQSVNDEATQINDAVNVLTPYIQQLVDGQSVQLQPADVEAVSNALSGLTGSVDNLQGLEPPHVEAT
jgi:hypothetical protein